MRTPTDSSGNISPNKPISEISAIGRYAGFKMSWTTGQEKHLATKRQVFYSWICSNHWYHSVALEIRIQGPFPNILKIRISGKNTSLPSSDYPCFMWIALWIYQINDWYKRRKYNWLKNRQIKFPKNKQNLSSLCQPPNRIFCPRFSNALHFLLVCFQTTFHSNRATAVIAPAVRQSASLRRCKYERTHYDRISRRLAP